MNSLIGKGEDRFTGHIHLLTCTWQPAYCQQISSRALKKEDWSLAKPGVHPGCCYPPYTALRQAKVGLELEKVYFQSGQLPTCLIQNPGTRARPAPHARSQGNSTSWMYSWSRGDLNDSSTPVNSHTRICSAWFLCRLYLTTGNPATTNSKS